MRKIKSKLIKLEFYYLSVLMMNIDEIQTELVLMQKPTVKDCTHFFTIEEFMNMQNKKLLQGS